MVLAVLEARWKIDRETMVSISKVPHDCEILAVSVGGDRHEESGSVIDVDIDGRVRLIPIPRPTSDDVATDAIEIPFESRLPRYENGWRRAGHGWLTPPWRKNSTCICPVIEAPGIVVRVDRVGYHTDNDPRLHDLTC
jgi:hypothetical protein